MSFIFVILGILLLMIVYLGVHIVKLIQLFFYEIKKKGVIVIFVCYMLIALGVFALSLFNSFNGYVIVKDISYGVLLTFLYSIFIFIIYDIIRLAAFLIKGRFYDFITSSKVKRICSCAVICLGMLIAIYGYIHARQIKIKNHDITINKTITQDSLNAVIISDMHLGADIGVDDVKKMVKKINSQEPDIVFIAGDIFNNNYEGLKNRDEVSALLKSINSVYGVYACLGNHDVDDMSFSDITGSRVLSSNKISEFLKESDIILLNDEVVLVADSFYVAGRKESNVVGGHLERLTLDELLSSIDMDKPVFLLDHRPEAVEEAVSYGVDLIMCGHTHNGQIFPGNLIIAITNEYGYGYYKVDNTNVLVSSGIGYWGPAYRIGSDSEIVRMNIQLTKTNSNEYDEDNIDNSEKVIINGEDKKDNDEDNKVNENTSINNDNSDDNNTSQNNNDESNNKNIYDDDPFIEVIGDWRKFSEGLMAVSGLTNSNISKYVDKNGNTVIPERFMRADDFSEGLAFVKEVTMPNSWEYMVTGGYIDSKGNYVIPPLFTSGEKFNYGKAIVELYGNFQIIDKEGRYLLDKSYEEIRLYNNKYYLCMSNNITDIFRTDLSLINSFDGYVWSINIYEGTEYLLMMKERYKSTEIYDINTKEMLFEFNGFATIYMLEETIYIHNYISESKTEELHDISLPKKENTLIWSEPTVTGNDIILASKDVIYISKIDTEETFIVINGEKQKVDYINSIRYVNFGYYAIRYINDYSIEENNLFALTDIYGNIVVPYGNHSFYSTKNRLIKFEEGIIYIYDSTLQVIKQIDNFLRCYTFNNYIFAFDTDGIYIFDEDGNIYYRGLGVTDSSHNYNDIYLYKGLSNYGYTLLDKRITDVMIPEYSIAPAKMTDAGMLDTDIAVFLKIGSLKKYIDGSYSDQAEKNEILTEDGEIYLSLEMLCKIFPGLYVDSTFPENPIMTNSHYMMKVYSDKDNAVQSYFDFNKNEYTVNELMLEFPYKTIDGDRYISLNETCKLLGFYTYSDNGICGISNAPITLTDNEAQAINEGF